MTRTEADDDAAGNELFFSMSSTTNDDAASSSAVELPFDQVCRRTQRLLDELVDTMRTVAGEEGGEQEGTTTRSRKEREKRKHHKHETTEMVTPKMNKRCRSRIARTFTEVTRRCNIDIVRNDNDGTRSESPPVRREIRRREGRHERRDLRRRRIDWLIANKTSALETRRKEEERLKETLAGIEIDLSEDEVNMLIGETRCPGKENAAPTTEEARKTTRKRKKTMHRRNRENDVAPFVSKLLSHNGEGKYWRMGRRSQRRRRRARSSSKPNWR